MLIIFGSRLIIRIEITCTSLFFGTKNNLGVHTIVCVHECDRVSLFSLRLLRWEWFIATFIILSFRPGESPTVQRDVSKPSTFGTLQLPQPFTVICNVGLVSTVMTQHIFTRTRSNMVNERLLVIQIRGLRVVGLVTYSRFVLVPSFTTYVLFFNDPDKLLGAGELFRVSFDSSLAAANVGISKDVPGLRERRRNNCFELRISNSKVFVVENVESFPLFLQLS